MKPRFFAALTLLLATSAAPVFAGGWDESVLGDLSNDHLAPTLGTLTPGNNIVTGSFNATDPDYLTVLVPDGFALVGIITGVNTFPGLARSFIGVQAGSTMTFPPDSPDATGLLGWTHFSAADGVNLLIDMGVPKAGSTGFSGPLQAGAYTFWFNETQTSVAVYDFNFQLQAVPIPPAIALFASGLLMLGRAAWRRRATS